MTKAACSPETLILHPTTEYGRLKTDKNGALKRRGSGRNFLATKKNYLPLKSLLHGVKIKYSVKNKHFP
jgi:hypothetical protein